MMRNEIRHRAILIVLVFAVSVALGACGGNDETPTPTPVSTVAENYLLTIEGKVTRAGVVVTAGRLEIFTPTGVCGETTVKADGTYELPVYGERQGRRLGCAERKTGRIRLDGVEYNAGIDLKPRKRPLELDLAFP